jgi:hypothetical protein
MAQRPARKENDVDRHTTDLARKGKKVGEVTWRARNERGRNRRRHAGAHTSVQMPEGAYPRILQVNEPTCTVHYAHSAIRIKHTAICIDFLYHGIQFNSHVTRKS